MATSKKNSTSKTELKLKEEDSFRCDFRFDLRRIAPREPDKGQKPGSRLGSRLK